MGACIFFRKWEREILTDFVARFCVPNYGRKRRAWGRQVTELLPRLPFGALALRRPSGCSEASSDSGDGPYGSSGRSGACLGSCAPANLSGNPDELSSQRRRADSRRHDEEGEEFRGHRKFSLMAFPWPTERVTGRDMQHAMRFPSGLPALFPGPFPDS